MPLKDVLIAALSRPAGRVVDGPVRDIVEAALKERGYASPAEVAALKDEIAAVRAQSAALGPRLDQLDAKLDQARGEASALREALASAATSASEARARADAADQVAAGLNAELQRVTQALAALQAAPPAPAAAPPAPAAAPPAPVAAPAAPAPAPALKGGAPACRVPACGVSAVSNGFCREHQLQWRSGRLAGFVGPEGLVDLDGRPGRVDLASAGLPYQVADGRLKIGGRFASVTLL